MFEIPGSPRPPDEETIRDIAADFHMSLSDEEAAALVEMSEVFVALYRHLDELPNPRPHVEYTDRDLGHRVPRSGDEDPMNAWVTRCHVAGADGGPLAGYEVGLKDNVALAGIEMTCGSRLLEGYVPQFDATLVTRLLDAGAKITGKLNMESLAVSASGELSDFGACLNPHSENHLAGGSSSGSAAAVVTGDVDVAIGSDQGGSIRVPSSWSGCVGLKPTYSLVPYTGAIGTGHTFDHAGPMATNVRDVARVLDAIAGKDPLDPRQGNVRIEEYEAALQVEGAQDPSDISVGVLAEGFDREESDANVDEAVRDALEEFEAEGATAEAVSIPYHIDAEAILFCVAMGETTALVESEGIGKFGKGFYDQSFANAFGRARRAQANDFPVFLKAELVIGRYFADRYREYYHAKAQNLRRPLTGAYDDVLADVDVLAMPTTPKTAHEVRDEMSTFDAMERAVNMTTNTAPFDASGHPAISVPCGDVDGLPVGLQFVSGKFEDATALRAAHAFEKSVGFGC
jgi:amidase